jgi:hypothetical protein
VGRLFDYSFSTVAGYSLFGSTDEGLNSHLPPRSYRRAWPYSTCVRGSIVIEDLHFLHRSTSSRSNSRWRRSSTTGTISGECWACGIRWLESRRRWDIIPLLLPLQQRRQLLGRVTESTVSTACGGGRGKGGYALACARGWWLVSYSSSFPNSWLRR